MEIVDVYFPPGVLDKVHARGTDEEMVFRALTASRDRGERGPLVVGQWTEDDGSPDLLVLAQDPVTGAYLEVGCVIEADGSARCYHAMGMRERDRQRFRERR